jgi:asparagine synthase (glutamine-hydrolysing)
VSGIAALFARDRGPADGALLARMIAALRSRGPDGEGTWSSGSVALGHTQHRTTLEAAREVSPASLDDRLFITADARIDARDELCARLRDHDRDVPVDLPDAELILHAYDAWGEGCLQYLLGDFSFALWDARRRALLCAVDPLGVRAFFYADRGGLFIGSNSLSCVRLHTGVREELNARAVGDFILVGNYEDRDVTIYADVARIPPGHFLIVGADGLRRTRYFHGLEPTTPAGAREDDCVEAFRDLLGHAVRDRLRTPKVGITMSGGVDSAVVALTATRELRQRFPAPELRAYTGVYDHLIPDDERRLAGLVARSLSIPIDVQAMDDGSLFDWVGQLRPPEPIADFVFGPFLAQLARLSSHSPVVLTGYDGDTMLAVALRVHWRERLVRGELATLARELAWYVRTQRALPPVGVRTFFADRDRTLAPRHRPSWLREEFWTRAGLAHRWSAADAPLAVSRPRDPAVRGFGTRAWSGFFDAHDPDTLGRPIEFRHPLLDLRLIRFAIGLPAIPWCVNKHILRRCLGDLPAEIRQRPKTPLARDPITELIRRRGMGSVPAPAPSETLAPFIDVAAVRQALNRSSEPTEETWLALRAVALGTWLEQRDAARDRAVSGPPGVLGWRPDARQEGREREGPFRSVGA